METGERIAVATLVANRTSTYALLGRLYREEVDQTLLDQLRQMDLAIGAEVPQIEQGYQQLKGFLDQVHEDSLTDLAVDYARVFIGAGLPVKGGAYPYESFYTSPDRILMQDARDEVLKFYRQEGLDKSSEFAEPEDHLALELEFMAFLCHKTAGALNVGDRTAALGYLSTQAVFLEQHLLNWVPLLCADIQRLARTSFYRAVAQITLAYLQLEREVIADLVSELTSPVT